MNFAKILISAAIAACLLSLAAIPAYGQPQNEYDLTTDNTTTDYNINGATWERFQPDTPTGSGVFYSFLRIAADPNERGYNTDGRPLQFDEKTAANFTRSIRFSDVPLIDGEREFQLDINENKSDPAWYMSLDKFQVWITDDPDLLGYDELTGTFAPGTATLVYDLDVGTDGDSTIKMDFRANPGSGKRDYRVLVPESMFDALGADEETDYVVLFTRHGDTWPTDDGYEEWGVAVYIELGTMVTIDASDTLIRKGDTITLTVTETNNGDSEESLTDPNVIITPGDIFLDKDSPYYAGGDDTGGGAGDLDYGETWVWNVPITVDEDTTFTADGHGIYTFVTGKGHNKVETRYDVSYDGGYEDERASIEIDTIEPNTTVDIDASAYLVYADDTVDLYISEENTGDDPLENVAVDIYYNQGSGDVFYGTVTYPPDSGDTHNFGVLDTDETWYWTVYSVPVSTDTTFIAIGYGEDSLGDPVTYPDFENEMDYVDVDTISPDTLVDIEASTNLVYAGGSVDLYISEENTGNDPLTNVSVDVYYNEGSGDVLYDTVTAPPDSGDTHNIGVLDDDETWYWTIYSVPVGVNTTFIAIGYGEDSLGNPVTWDAFENERDYVDVDTINPDTLVDIDASAYKVYADDTVDLYVSEENTGDDPLSNVAVDIYYDEGIGDVLYGTLTAPPDSGDTHNIGVLDDDETWYWTIYDVPVSVDTTFTAIGYGEDSLGYPVTWDAYEDELDFVDVGTITPGTLVDIDASDSLIYAGESVDLYISEENTGDNPLENVAVDIYYNLGSGDVYYGTVTAPPDSGDTHNTGVLDDDETWYWTVSDVPVGADITFIAVGYGEDEFGNPVTYPDFEDELDTVDVDTISPDTLVDIDASAYLVYADDTVDLYVSEENTGDDPLENVSVEIYYNEGSGDVLYTTLTAPPSSGDTHNFGVLDDDETWYWTVGSVPVGVDTTFTAIGYGEDSLGNPVTWDAYEYELDYVDVYTINPDTMLTIDSDVYETTPGGNVWLTITEENTGDDPLEDVTIEVYYDEGAGDLLLTTLTDPPDSGDTHNTGVLDDDEIWTWYYQTTVSDDTTFTAIGHGTDSLGNDVTYDEYPNELDSVLVEVEEGFTRTWGFWKTHLYLVQYIFLDGGYLTLPIDFGVWGSNGPRQVNTVCDYMGLMWCNQSNNTTGTKRTKIDAARIHTAHQALAAIMNASMPNGASLPVSLTYIADTLSGSNEKAIRDLGSLLAAYNESGEYVALDPSLPPTGRTSGNIADPQGARLAGADCEAYWNTEQDTSRGKGNNKQLSRPD